MSAASAARPFALAAGSAVNGSMVSRAGAPGRAFPAGRVSRHVPATRPPITTTGCTKPPPVWMRRAYLASSTRPRSR